MACKVKEIMTIMEDIAPSSEAEEWDNAGLLLGDKEAEVRRIMVTLDITGELMKEAAQKGVDMIVAHHPLIFKPIKSIQKDSVVGGIIYSLIQNNISVVCCHTNLDKAPGGVDDTLARVLGLDEVKPLASSSAKESPGFGRLGRLKKPTSMMEYLKEIKRILRTDRLDVIGSLDKNVEWVASCAGSGADFLKDAVLQGADLFVTGEIKYHDAQEAAEMGITVAAAGHYATEAPVLQELIYRLQNALNALQYKVDIILPNTRTDPYQAIGE